MHRVLAALAGSLGALALAAGEPYPSRAGPTHLVTAIDLARWIRQPKPGLRVIDLRSVGEFTAYHVPGAEHVDLGDLADRDWSAGLTTVVYAAADERAVEAVRALRSRGVDTVHVLGGGLAAWIAQIIEPRLGPLPPSATPPERAARREHLELSRYFGGTPFVSPDAVPVPAGRRRSEADVVARTIRRGC
jgi:rhodanese-related sulfurtransferase